MSTVCVIEDGNARYRLTNGRQGPHTSAITAYRWDDTGGWVQLERLVCSQTPPTIRAVVHRLVHVHGVSIDNVYAYPELGPVQGPTDVAMALGIGPDQLAIDCEIDLELTRVLDEDGNTVSEPANA